ncbi:RHS repeat-associated core domain-containing protein, partial [Pseudomonas sp. PB106]|uniref:RHS repeat-associated core domain-containing protein n=1 Tax=Pseudomonas sp. PB106 TaxID=2494699 RepID=UPI00131B831A
EHIADTRHGQRTYGYDALDRLIRVRHSRDELPESFAHDPAGNLLMQDRPGPSQIKGNRLLMQGDRHYDYDAFGNLIRERRGTAQKLVTEYRYDCQHRLIGLTRPDGQTASYQYDAFGRRIRKTVDGQVTEFFWQGEQVVAESSQSEYRSYVYEPGTFRPLALLDGKGPKKACPFYYQLDHLGTPLELTDYSGEIVWSAQYDAYGKVAALSLAADEYLNQPLRFQGQYFDAESGLHYNRHRYYDPRLGRYLTPDPVKLAGGLNQYQYVPNPTGWVDPLGLNSNCPPPNKPGCEVPGGSDGVKVDEGGPILPAIAHNIDPKTLKRVHTIEGKNSTRTVEDYKNKMRNGYDPADPIDVIEHEGSLYILNGHHRAAAARQTSTNVTIKLITDLQAYNGALRSIEDVLESANNVGLDRLEHKRRR